MPAGFYARGRDDDLIFGPSVFLIPPFLSGAMIGQEILNNCSNYLKIGPRQSRFY